MKSSEDKMKQLMLEYSKKKLAKVYGIMKKISEDLNIFIQKLIVVLDIMYRMVTRYIRIK